MIFGQLQAGRPGGQSRGGHPGNSADKYTEHTEEKKERRLKSVFPSNTSFSRSSLLQGVARKDSGQMARVRDRPVSSISKDRRRIVVTSLRGVKFVTTTRPQTELRGITRTCAAAGFSAMRSRAVASQITRAHAELEAVLVLTKSRAKHSTCDLQGLLQPTPFFSE